MPQWWNLNGPLSCCSKMQNAFQFKKRYLIYIWCIPTLQTLLSFDQDSFIIVIDHQTCRRGISTTSYSIIRTLFSPSFHFKQVSLACSCQTQWVEILLFIYHILQNSCYAFNQKSIQYWQKKEKEKKHLIEIWFVLGLRPSKIISAHFVSFSQLPPALLSRQGI